MSEKEIVFVGRMQNKTRDYIHNLEKENRELQQENQQLKEDYDCAFQDAEELNQRLTEVIDERNNLLSVLDEIKILSVKYNLGKYDYSIPMFEIEEILDKVKSNE